MGAVENPNAISAAAVVVPVPAFPFVRELVQSRGVASFERLSAGQYLFVLEQPATFQGTIPRVTFAVNTRLFGGAQTLADGTVRVSVYDADTGVPEDPDAFFFSVLSFVEGEGGGPVLPIAPVPPPIPPGGVISVFGRAGVVIAMLGDYAASLITNDSTVAGATVKDALDALLAAIPPAAPVSSVFGRVGAVIALLGDYAASQVTNDSGVTGATVKDALNALLAAIPSVPVSSVFGRVGAVVATVGDYTSSQVNNASGVTGATVTAALNALLAAIPSVPVSSVFGRVGAVVAAVGDYTSSQVNNASGVTGATVTAALDALAASILAVPAFLIADFSTGQASAVVNEFQTPFGMGSPHTAEARCQVMAPATYQVTALTMSSDRTGGVSGNTVATLRKNGVATALTVTLTAGQSSVRATGGPITFTGGTDRMSVQLTTVADATGLAIGVYGTK